MLLTEMNLQGGNGSSVSLQAALHHSVISFLFQRTGRFYSLRNSLFNELLKKNIYPVVSQWRMTCVLYLEHVCVFVMAVLHHHSLVPGQRVGDAVLALTVYSLQCNSKEISFIFSCFWFRKHCFENVRFEASVIWMAVLTPCHYFRHKHPSHLLEKHIKVTWLCKTI